MEGLRLFQIPVRDETFPVVKQLGERFGYIFQEDKLKFSDTTIWLVFKENMWVYQTTVPVIHLPAYDRLPDIVNAMRKKSITINGVKYIRRRLCGKDQITNDKNVNHFSEATLDAMITLTGLPYNERPVMQFPTQDNVTLGTPDQVVLSHADLVKIKSELF